MPDQSEQHWRDHAPALVSLAILLLAAALSQAAVPWKQAQAQGDDFLATPEALHLADNILACQRPTGGWDKNVDYAKNLTDEQKAHVDYNSTIDNGATTGEMIFLARLFHATGDQRYADAFLRGFDFLIEMQYDNGGWPQIYPLAGGYHDNITYNDDAMVRVLNLLRDVSRRAPLYSFVDDARRDRATRAIDKGIACILATQVVVDGKRTVWCAQHDPVTFAPAKARAYELPSLSGMETVPIVRFLMSVEDPDRRVIEAVQSAIAWLDEVKLTDTEMVDTTTDGKRDRVLVPTPGARPLWARFYEIGTNRPMFCGRDGAVKYNLGDIEQERRAGYRWYTGRANELFDSEYPDWQKRHAPDANMLAGR